MRLFLLAALLAVGPAVAADAMVASQGRDSVRITEAACKLSVPNKENLRAASAIIGGKTYVACWTVSQGAVALIYEDGDIGIVPVGEFKPAPSI